MAVQITIPQDTQNAETLADTLRHIADLLNKGYTSGNYPTWEMTGEEEPTQIED
jgi:hypothetical protein